jgi:hypothetical protein
MPYAVQRRTTILESYGCISDRLFRDFGCP